MRLMNVNWKTVIASMFVASAVLMTGCDSQSVGNESTPPDEENSTSEPADVEIEAPGFDLEIRSDQDDASVDVEASDEKQSEAVDIDVNSPE